MKLMLWSVVLAMLTALCSPAQAVLYSYFDDPIEDATVDNVAVLANYGNEPTLQVQGTGDMPLYALGSVKRIFLKFDISAIPDGAEILHAEFGIYFAEGNQGGVQTTDPHAALYLVTDDSWQEMAINWNSKPDFEPGYVDDEMPLAATGMYYTWNLLSDLGQNAWTDYATDLADDYLSLMLVVPDEDLNNFAIFNSSEAADNLPYLSIGYVPEPATLFMLGLGGLWLLRRK